MKGERKKMLQAICSNISFLLEGLALSHGRFKRDVRT